MAKTDTSKPVKKFHGKGVHVNVFRNEVDDKVSYKATVARIYHDGKDFQTSNSFGIVELPLLKLLVDDAWRFILEEEAKNKKQN